MFSLEVHIRWNMLPYLESKVHGPIMPINSWFAPVRFTWNFWRVICKIILVTEGWSISDEILLWWLSLDLAKEKSISVQTMAWYRQSTRHSLSQCWPRFPPPYALTTPSLLISPGQNRLRFADDIFRCIFMNEKLCILIQISLKFVRRSPKDNKPALLHVLSWWQVITWANHDPVHWRIYAALGVMGW